MQADFSLLRGTRGRGASLGGLFGRLARAVRSGRRYAAARREFDSLDAAALRDLGLGPSEFNSYWAESEGAAEASRRRLAACR